MKKMALVVISALWLASAASAETVYMRKGDVPAVNTVMHIRRGPLAQASMVCGGQTRTVPPYQAYYNFLGQGRIAPAYTEPGMFLDEGADYLAGPSVDTGCTIEFAPVVALNIRKR